MDAYGIVRIVPLGLREFLESVHSVVASAKHLCLATTSTLDANEDFEHSAVSHAAASG